MAKKVITTEEKREIVQLEAAGCKVAAIASKFDTSKSAVYAIIKDYKEHGEQAFEDKKEPAAEAPQAKTNEDVDVHIIADVSEDVNPCEEYDGTEFDVTPDTDMKEYLKAHPRDIATGYVFSEAARTAIEKEIERCKEDVGKLNKSIEELEKMILKYKSMIEEKEDTITQLYADYSAMGGKRE